MTHRFRPVVIASLLVAGLAQEPLAQAGSVWPEEPENLRVLPRDFTGRQLRAVMTGFTRALGVRCSHCHVGEEGEPLTTYDFASDANPRKNAARTMLNMLSVINDSLESLDLELDHRVNMWCHTCHRGRPRPFSLGEELGMAFDEEGAASALARYEDLRDRFHGRGAYDFGESALNQLGYRALEAGEIDVAIEIFERNAGYFPASANVFDSLAEAHVRAGDIDRAIANYQRSLELDPNNANARKQLEQLQEN